eukprot:SAG22_NODE_1085_length_5632_cov_40.777697_4_plen_76_part_00
MPAEEPADRPPVAGLAAQAAGALQPLLQPAGQLVRHGRAAEEHHPHDDRQTARKGTVLDRKTVEARQKGSALVLT